MVSVVREIRASERATLLPHTQAVGAPLERLTYTVDEVAHILGLSRSKTYELVARGEIPVVPVSGRRRLIARVVVERLLGADENPECG